MPVSFGGWEHPALIFFSFFSNPRQPFLHFPCNTCSSIGVSNFNRRQLAEVSTCSKHKPTVLQNECHPYLQEKDLLDYCRSEGILLQAYSPLGSYDRPWAKPGDPELLQDPRLLKIAEKHGKTAAQVCGLVRGLISC